MKRAIVTVTTVHVMDFDDFKASEENEVGEALTEENARQLLKEQVMDEPGIVFDAEETVFEVSVTVVEVK